MNTFQNFSIRLKLILAIVSILFISLSVFSSLILFMNYQKNTQDLLNESNLQAGLISDYAITPLLFSDVSGATEILTKLQSIPNINSAVMYDEKGNVFASYSINKKQKMKFKKINSFKESIVFTKDELVIFSRVQHNKNLYGGMLFHISTSSVAKETLNHAFILMGGIIVIILFSFIMISRLQKYITLPIITLSKITQTIALSEDYTTRAQKMYGDEVGQLYDDFNAMLEKIEQRGRQREEAETISRTYQSHLERLTNELEERVQDRTGELQESLERLQSAQSQLIESEKMSALGNLVAGVAHEVNTPLGISITAASIFKNEIKTLTELLEQNKLSKTALNHFIETISEADDILIKNLDRAASLVRNFKKISVDQSSEEKRIFELNEYLIEVVSTFKNELKHRPIDLILDLDDKQLSMNSYPGAISQIVVNMLQNALLHGFDNEDKGEIHLKTEHKEDTVLLIFSDTGKGVDPYISDKIFEPFITTKRNKGGTGLGLNITYNLVTQQLKGSIELDNNYHEGARFIIEIPYSI
ncbi:HAMP domain-containing protein [Sulfurimonas sp. MAG313]|nr:ATP-binding protein [Sulfurimonas sp. MAG313]MDF1881341.1 HAMP domain-containing protein [Sulfurimonas sp. MAG313]